MPVTVATLDDIPRPEVREVREVRAGESIQEALDSAARVRLGAGVHWVDRPLHIRSEQILEGVGAKSILRALVPIAEVVNFTGPMGQSEVRDLVIDANRMATNGLTINPSGPNAQDAPDPALRARGLWVYDAVRVGVLVGPQARSTVLDTIRVRRAGLHGFELRMPDSWVTTCEATTAAPGGAGFFVGSVNTVYSGLKAWYCRSYGFHVKGTRNHIANSYSQDTGSHGWRVEWDKNTFTNVQADTAGMYDVGGTPNSADGFYFDGAGTNVVVGALSYDRRPGGKPAQQRYGFNMPRSFFESGQFIGYSGYGNVANLLNLR